MPAASVGFARGQEWTIWAVDDQMPLFPNTANGSIFGGSRPHKRFRLVEMREQYHTISPSQRKYTMHDATKATIRSWDKPGQLVHAYRVAVEAHCGFTPEPLFGGLIGEEE